LKYQASTVGLPSVGVDVCGRRATAVEANIYGHPEQSAIRPHPGFADWLALAQTEKSDHARKPIPFVGHAAKRRQGTIPIKID
jgi:hypothetical protein